MTEREGGRIAKHQYKKWEAQGLLTSNGNGAFLGRPLLKALSVLYNSLEFHQDGQIYPVLNLLEIGEPRTPGRPIPNREAAQTRQRAGSARISARRRNSSRSRKIGYIRAAMIDLPPERD